MSKLISLKNSSEFGNVYKNGKSYANRLFVMYVVPNGLEFNRIGICVSKKIGNSVVRHRTTRLVREVFRLSGNVFNSGLDIVVVARAGVRDKNFFDVNNAILHLGRVSRSIK